MDNKIALGMIETKGLVGLIEASDAAVKAAEVIAVDYEQTGSGLCIVKLRGTVGAVKAAVEAGARAAQKIGQLIAAHVIPNPDSGVEPMITPVEHSGTREPAKEFHKWGKAKGKEAREKPTARRATGAPKETRLNAIMAKIRKEGTNSLEYNELRYIARHIENFPLSKAEIRTAGKARLLKYVAEIFAKR